MNSSLYFTILNTILAAGFIIYAIVNKYKQNLVLNSFKPEELRSNFKKLDKISKFIEDELTQPELTEEEEIIEQQKAVEAMKPLVKMIGEDVFSRFQKSKAGLTRTMNINEKKLDHALFIDGLENHPQGDLINLAINSGIVGKETIALVEKNPLMLDFVLNKFGPQIEALQKQLTGKESGGSTPSNSGSGGYTGDI